MKMCLSNVVYNKMGTEVLIIGKDTKD